MEFKLSIEIFIRLSGAVSRFVLFYVGFYRRIARCRTREPGASLLGYELLCQACHCFVQLSTERGSVVFQRELAAPLPVAEHETRAQS